MPFGGPVLGCITAVAAWQQITCSHGCMLACLLHCDRTLFVLSTPAESGVRPLCLVLMAEACKGSQVFTCHEHKVEFRVSGCI